MIEIEKLTCLLSTEVVAQTFLAGSVRGAWKHSAGGWPGGPGGHVGGVCSLSIDGSCSPGIRLVQPSVLSYLKFLN